MDPLTRFQKAVDSIAAVGESRQRYIKIVRQASGEFKVALEPRWYQRVDEHAFKSEFLSAMADVKADYSQQRAALFRQHFRTHLHEAAPDRGGDR